MKPRPTTVEEFHRPEHKHFITNIEIERRQRGIASVTPLTPWSINSKLLTCCKVSNPNDEQLLHRFVMRRRGNYANCDGSSEQQRYWLSTRPPVFDLIDNTACGGRGRRLAIVNVPPVLPLPQATLLSVREYLTFIGQDHIEVPADDVNSGKDLLSYLHPHIHQGGGVVVATREEFSFFVCRQYHEIFAFVEEPTQMVSNEFGNQSGAVESEEALRATVREFMRKIVGSSAFMTANTWWYRCDPLAGDMMKLVLNEVMEERGDSCSPSAFLQDPRWVMLPRTKVLKNGKWNIEPHCIGKELQYGLLELLSGDEASRNGGRKNANNNNTADALLVF